MRPSVALDLKRSTVREATSRFSAANPRVFGSVLHGTDQDGSDIDLHAVWDTVQIVLPVLLKQLPAVQQDVEDEEHNDDHSGDKSC
jgi:predicted nucleotidyltransferase